MGHDAMDPATFRRVGLADIHLPEGNPWANAVTATGVRTICSAIALSGLPSLTARILEAIGKIGRLKWVYAGTHPSSH